LNLGVGLSTGKMIKHMTNVHNRSHVDHLWMNSDDDTKRLNSRLKELLIAENSELESTEADNDEKQPRFQEATAARLSR